MAQSGASRKCLCKQIIGTCKTLKKNVHFSLATPFSHLCTADVSVPLDTNERSSDLSSHVLLHRGPHPLVRCSFAKMCAIRVNGLHFPHFKISWKIVTFEAETFNFSTSIHLFHLSPHLVKLWRGSGALQPPH